MELLYLFEKEKCYLVKDCLVIIDGVIKEFKFIFV